MSDKKKSQSLFSGLEEFGLEKLDRISLYEKEQTKPEASTQKKKEKSEEDFLFDKKVDCPVCNSEVMTRMVKRSLLRIVSRDSDSMPIYEGINPLFYDVWLCNQCGYAASEKQFRQKLLKEQVIEIQQRITAKWRPKNYPSLYHADIALERFKLALYNAVVRKARDSEVAMLCLKMAWVYRSKEDTENELQCLKQALVGFEKAFSQERFPIVGMDECGLMYLIGELYRRTGDFTTALRWFGRVIINPQAKPSIKDKARDQKYMITEIMEEKEKTEATIETNAEGESRANQNKKGLGRFFSIGLTN
ncbi:MAG: DUF2225 domain-containing protein [Syntrophomonadaceae bacterium]|nr:DUF2225 domain-containing protein [Syntrophomonadaceae bacterium]